ncbi:rhodanese-like domain-containing protein [Candidatus Woesearchaeota archaeon]|nr:rhodanese-like domain-containing protein [Candidatus Woesearchaeota archaeon]
MKTKTIFLVLILVLLVGCTQKVMEQETEMEEKASYMDVSPMKAKELIDTNPNLIVIDVSPHYDNGHLPGAVHYYLGDGSLDAAIPTLDKEKDYLVYCHVDSVAIAGAQKLIDAGFTTVYRLEGNYGAWVDAGYPIEK